MIIDGILGLSDDRIYANYELPTLNKGLPRLRYARKAAGMFGGLDPKTSKLGGKTISENVVKYLLASGLTESDLDAVRSIMLEK